MVDPLALKKAGIPVYKVNQRPRDYVVTFLKVYFLLLRLITVVFLMDLIYVKQSTLCFTMILIVSRSLLSFMNSKKNIKEKNLNQM